MTNNRYKLLQINFDVNTVIYCLGTNFVHFLVSYKIEAYDLIQLVSFVSDGVIDLLTPKSSNFILKYIKVYFVTHKRLSLRFGNFRSIFQRM